MLLSTLQHLIINVNKQLVKLEQEKLSIKRCNPLASKHKTSIGENHCSVEQRSHTDFLPCSLCANMLEYAQYVHYDIVVPSCFFD